jgi:NAD(P)-dependent dehydrogenase (short-subunit alcohol dehydrogenase family)
MQPTRLRGTVALVTGAGQGIGRAIAYRFIVEGAQVVAMDTNRDALEDAADEYGEAFVPVVGSIAKDGDVSRAVAKAVTLGTVTGGFDVLVNNAAIADPNNGPLEKLAVEDWQRVIDVNLTGTFLMCRRAIPFLRKAGRGVITNITSTRAYMSEPNTEAYSTTKAALVGLTHSLANSLGPDIRVNAVAPGWIATDAWKPRKEREQPKLRDIDQTQHPAGRVGRPEDIAAICAYLASNESDFITGQVFVVDGGMNRKMIYEE